jgi:hypothetical protein
MYALERFTPLNNFFVEKRTRQLCEKGTGAKSEPLNSFTLVDNIIEELNFNSH